MAFSIAADGHPIAGNGYAGNVIANNSCNLPQAFPMRSIIGNDSSGGTDYNDLPTIR